MASTPYSPFAFDDSRFTFMHILIIPSEEFVPDYNKLDGIFQYHQAILLQEAGHRIGVLSVKLNFSLPMIAKGIWFKIAGKKAGNATDNHSIPYLLKLGFQKALQPKKFITQEVLDGLTVYRVDGLFYRPPVNNKNHQSWTKAGMDCFAAYEKAEGRPDVIHAHNGIYAGMLAQKIKERYGIRYLITEHSSTYALNLADESTLLRVKKAYDGAAALFAVSEAFAKMLNKQFSFDRVGYLPNVLDRELEKHAWNPPQKRLGKFVFLNIAGLLPVKDQQTLLKAFRQVVDKNANAELWIAGGGELLPDLMKQTADLGIDNAVKFLGVLNRQEVISRIQASDCFVLSSKYETFGVVLIEAMLFGKPVISTRVGVGQDIVSENVGYVTEVGDADGFAAAMLKMASSGDRYEAERIRAFTLSHFGGEAFVKKITKIYGDVTGIETDTPHRNKTAAAVS